MDALFGDYETIRRSGLFDPEYYLATYPDVADGNLDPLVHYLEEGARQGRNPHPGFRQRLLSGTVRQRGEQPQNPLIHYLRLGMARGFKTRREEDPVGGGARRRQAPEQAAGSPIPMAPILVAIETLGIEGQPGGGSRVSAGGWALASAPIADITVTVAATRSPSPPTDWRGRTSRGFTRIATGPPNAVSCWFSTCPARRSEQSSRC